jgi:hypothetical protein
MQFYVKRTRFAIKLIRFVSNLVRDGAFRTLFDLNRTRNGANRTLFNIKRTRNRVNRVRNALKLVRNDSNPVSDDAERVAFAAEVIIFVKNRVNYCLMDESFMSYHGADVQQAHQNEALRISAEQICSEA